MTRQTPAVTRMPVESHGTVAPGAGPGSTGSGVAASARAGLDALLSAPLADSLVQPGRLDRWSVAIPCLVFGMDATGSREAGWERAIAVQGAMFEAVDTLGGIAVKLVYFGGVSCRQSAYLSCGAELARLMRTVRCASGVTQIGKVMAAVEADTLVRPVKALIYIGDTMEESEKDLLARARRLGAAGVKGFFFLEGGAQHAASAYQRFAGAMGGAFCTLDDSAPERLRDLLAAVAAYAVGGRAALADARHRNGAAQLLLAQMR